MRSTMAMTLLGFGMIFLAFGAVIFAINLLAARYGTPHPTGGILTLGFIAAGGILAAAGFFVNRSRGGPTSSN
jgi:hypothetical protein